MHAAHWVFDVAVQLAVLYHSVGHARSHARHCLFSCMVHGLAWYWLSPQAPPHGAHSVFALEVQLKVV